MGGKPSRTPSGDVSAAARKKYGNDAGAFPVFDHESAIAAVNLRGHHDDPSKVLDKVSRYANANNDDAAKKAVASARKADAKKKN